MLPDWLTGGGATKESETKRDGFLSYSAEIHSVGLGVYDGMKTWRVQPKKMRDNSDVDKEPHYYAGGYVAGTILQFVIVLAIALVGL
jgi:hypothetical protein